MSGIISSIGNILTGGGGDTANKGAALSDPFAGQRGQYQDQLSALMKDPSSVTKTPGYQFNFDQGLEALQRQEAATGNLNSGTADIGAVQYGQNYAKSTFNQYEQMLAQLAGGNLSQGDAGSVYAKANQGSNSATSGLFGSLLSTITGAGGSGGGGGIMSGLLGLFGGSAAAGGGSAAAGLGGFGDFIDLAALAA